MWGWKQCSIWDDMSTIQGHFLLYTQWLVWSSPLFELSISLQSFHLPQTFLVLCLSIQKLFRQWHISGFSHQSSDIRSGTCSVSTRKWCYLSSNAPWIDKPKWSHSQRLSFCQLLLRCLFGKLHFLLFHVTVPSDLHWKMQWRECGPAPCLQKDLARQMGGSHCLTFLDTPAKTKITNGTSPFQILNRRYIYKWLVVYCHSSTPPIKQREGKFTCPKLWSGPSEGFPLGI